MGDRSRYEHKTVKALRGVERMVIAKWEKRGWELSDQTSGTMRTDLTFRRSKPRVTRQALAIGALAGVCAAGTAIGGLTEGEDKGDAGNQGDKAGASSSPSTTGVDTADIDDFLAALRRGDLQDYAQGHNGDSMVFNAQVTGVGTPALKAVGFINLRAVIDGNAQGPLLKLVFGGFSQIPFPSHLRRGSMVEVRAKIDRYFSDGEVWLTPDEEDSFIRARSSR
jgi:hypothetical protein